MTTNPPNTLSKSPQPPSESAAPTSEPPEKPSENAGGKHVLTPDQLPLRGDDVAPLGENRFLVRAGRGTESDRVATDAGDSDDEGSEPQGPTYARVLGAAPEPHGIDITLKTDGEIAHHRVMSRDVREVFVEMLTWYAAQLDDDLSPGEALKVMLSATDLEVE